MQPIHIYLYDEPRTANLRISEIRDYLAAKLPHATISCRPPFIDFHLSSHSAHAREQAIIALASEIASARIRNPTAHRSTIPPLPGEVDYERRRLGNPASKVFGILYDGIKLSQLFATLIPDAENRYDHVHIIFTNQLIGTWDLDDRRYHARVSIYSYPSILSTTGLVEAPAKPRQFYLLKKQYSAIGIYDASAVIKEDFRGRFLDHNDPKTTEAMKGYVLQALFFHFVGDPFCQDPNCRLYNAHWQEEVIRAQLNGDYELCQRHQAMLEGGLL